MTGKKRKVKGGERKEGMHKNGRDRMDSTARRGKNKNAIASVEHAAKIIKKKISTSFARQPAHASGRKIP